MGNPRGLLNGKWLAILCELYRPFGELGTKSGLGTTLTSCYYGEDIVVFLAFGGHLEKLNAADYYLRV